MYICSLNEAVLKMKNIIIIFSFIYMVVSNTYAKTISVDSLNNLIEKNEQGDAVAQNRV